MHRLERCRLFPFLAILIASAHALSAGGALGAEVEKQIGTFTLSDTVGEQHTAEEFRRAKMVVLFFLGTECPVSNGYAPDMQRIADKYASRGVACYGVHCDPATTAESAAAHAKEYSLAFGIWLDPAQSIARAVGVRVTPEAVVVSPTGKVLYRGRIDDRYATSGKRRDDPTSYDLENALDQVLAGATPTVSETKAFGCPLPKLKRPD
jgi:peroxiredoxin